MTWNAPTLRMLAEGDDEGRALGACKRRIVVSQPGGCVILKKNGRLVNTKRIRRS